MVMTTMPSKKIGSSQLHMYENVYRNDRDGCNARELMGQEWFGLAAHEWSSITTWEPHSPST
jgi:hypothetical protein